MKNQLYITNDELWCLVQLAKLELAHLGKTRWDDEKNIVDKFYYFVCNTENSFTIEENDY